MRYFTFLFHIMSSEAWRVVLTYSTSQLALSTPPVPRGSQVGRHSFTGFCGFRLLFSKPIGSATIKAMDAQSI